MQIKDGTKAIAKAKQVTNSYVVPVKQSRVKRVPKLQLGLGLEVHTPTSRRGFESEVFGIRPLTRCGAVVLENSYFLLEKWQIFC